MKQKKQLPSPTVFCAVCGTEQTQSNKFESGKVCDACSESVREGRDNTTRAVKAQVKSLRYQAQAARDGYNGVEADEIADYQLAGGELFAREGFALSQLPVLGSGGEVVPEHDQIMRDTLAVPGVAAKEASANRLELVTRIGTDVAAMAVDAADTVGASNSIEKMYSHGLAVLHSKAMEMMSRTALESDPVISMRQMNIGIRAMEAFQRGAVNFNKLRGGGNQLIRIEHVNVAPGAQAIVGSIQTGRAGK